MSGHGGGGDMNGRRRSQQCSVGLLLEIAIGALHVAVGEGVVVRPVEPDGIGSCYHAAIGNARIAAEKKDAVGGSVQRLIRPCLSSLIGGLVVGEDNAALLNDG